MIEEGNDGPDFEDEQKKAALFQLLGSAHTLAIIREFAADPGPHRFTDLEEKLDISPTTLSDRLEELCEAEILHRKSHDEIPPRVEYRPTEKGEALRPIMDEVQQWIQEYSE